MGLGSTAGRGEEPESSLRRPRGRGGSDGHSGANALQAQGQQMGEAKTAVSGFGREVVPGGRAVSRVGGGQVRHSQMAEDWAAQGVSRLPLMAPITVASGA